MKTTKQLLSFAVLTLLMLACKPEFPPIGDIPSKLQGINAQWEMTMVEMIDLKDPLAPSIEITDFYTSSGGVKMNINSSDFTYTVDQTGGKMHFGTGGTWKFDDNEFPTNITFTTNEGKNIVMDLGATIRPQDENLKLKSSILDCNQERSIASYQFTFSRI